MKTSNYFKTITFLMILFLSGKIAYSQEPPTNLVLPESYYKGVEAKRKYAEQQKAASAKTMTLSTFYPENTVKKNEVVSPEVRAKSMLNTTSVPSDFPIYKAYSMTEKEYEASVAQWFRKNPSFRKINN